MNRKMKNKDSLKERVLESIRMQNLIEEGDTVIIGVSGGADSVCLLLLLLELRETLHCRLEAVHVEHGIRGEESLRDAAFVSRLCEEKGLPLQVVSVNAPTYAAECGLTVEEAARILRYRVFTEAAEALMQGGKAVKIAVAHHANDQAETMLFQMTRGSGLRGIGGMRPMRERIIRPLLRFSQREILAYLCANHQPYCVDETNADNGISRNRIRNEILPLFEEIQPQTVKHLSELSIDLQEAEAYIRKQADAVYVDALMASEEAEERVLRIAPLLETEPLLAKTVLQRAIAEVIPGRKDVQRCHIEDAAALLRKTSGKVLMLPKQVLIERENDRLRIRRRDTGKADRSPVKIAVGSVLETDDGYRIRTCKFAYTKGMSIPKDAYTKWFDYDKIKGDLQFRSRKNGDYLYIDSAMHRQKLQDYLVNQKIPRSERDQLPLVADSDGVLWILGYRISEQIKVSDETTTVIEIEITGGSK